MAWTMAKFSMAIFVDKLKHPYQIFLINETFATASTVTKFATAISVDKL
jgi:hypothetical protein